MQRLQRLKAGGKGITDIKGLEFAQNLVNLHLGDEGNYIADLSPLATLTSLTNLNLEGNQITDVSPLSALTTLVHLNLANNRVSNLNPLANLISLEILDLTRNHIEDINPLSRLRNLRTLWIKGNPIRDLSPLAGLNLTDLKYDDVALSEAQSVPSEQSIPDPTLRAAIRGDRGLLSDVHLTKGKMQRLEWSNADHKSIDNTRSLEFNTKLKEHPLGENSVVDAQRLANLTQLDHLLFWRIPLNPANLDVHPRTHFLNLKQNSLEKRHLLNSRPTAGLTHLQQLWIKRNRANAVSPPPELNLTERTFWAFP